MTKPHAEVEDIQKRTGAMELEVPVEFEMSMHVPPQAEATQASLVPDLSATNEAMECVSLESPVTSVCDVSEDSASLLSKDDHQEDDGK